MACYGCMTKFNFFNKENGCPSCGYAFCNKCLKQKALVPNKGNTEINICKPCYVSLTQKCTKKVVPPDALLKRLEKLENPAQAPITVYQPDSRIQQLRRGLSTEDQQIADRLEQLRNPSISPPSVSEIQRRLAKLKGENFYSNPPKKMVVPTDLRSEQQKVDDLLEKYSAERDIELAQDPASEIQARLATLRDAGVKPNSTAYLENLHEESSSDEETQIDKLTRKIMDEVAIENSMSTNSPTETNNTDKKHPHCLKSCDRGTPLHASTPELSYCQICFSDATRRCTDCESALYCDKCFIEIHRDWSETHHKWVEYVKSEPRTSEEEEEDNEEDDDEDI